MHQQQQQLLREQLLHAQLIHHLQILLVIIQLVLHLVEEQFILEVLERQLKMLVLQIQKDRLDNLANKHVHLSQSVKLRNVILVVLLDAVLIKT